MPSFISREWNGYKIRVIPNYEDKWRSFLWDTFRHELIPYLWGADISFDLKVKLPQHHDKTEIIKYEWRLYTRDDKEVLKFDEGIICEGIIQFSQTKSEWSFSKRVTGDVIRLPDRRRRKLAAINLGCISITDQYKLKMRFSDKNGTTSSDMVMAEFTIKDRDDVYLQMWWILVGAGVAVVAGIIGFMFGIR